MATQSPPQPTSAVARIEPQALALSADAGVTYNLDNFPEDRFNRLVPTQLLRLPSDLVVPVVQVIQLEPANREGKSRDHYKSSDVPAGHRAPTARGLNKIAAAAGVSFYDERRTDDGSDPMVMGVSVVAEEVLPTGQRRRSTGAQVIDLRTWFGSQTSEAEKAKFRKQFYAHVATRARNRALRALLSLPACYTDAEIARPFAVVSFAPNMEHPEMRQAIIAAYTGTTAALYGSTAQSPQLAAGPVIDVPEIDDEATEGQYVEVQTNGHATVDAATGEIVASSDDDAEPDWFGAGTSATPPDLATRLTALATESKASGPASTEQRQALNAAMKGINNKAVGAVVGALWGLGNLVDITAAQAAAILGIVQNVGQDAFRQQWLGLATDQARLAELAKARS